MFSVNDLIEMRETRMNCLLLDLARLSDDVCHTLFLHLSFLVEFANKPFVVAL